MNPVLFACFCLLSAGWLSLPIDEGLQQNRNVFGLENSLDRILGSAKEVIGDELFLKANAYYHGGVNETFEENEASHTKSGFIEDGPYEHQSDDRSKDWIEKINDQVTMHQHYHLEGDKIREMLPYFSLATTLDPYNIEAGLTTAYWLEKHFQKAEEAIDLLEKMVSYNPDSWEIENALGGLYYRVRNDMEKSQQHYRAAIQKSAGKSVENYLRMDMNYYLGESLYRSGRKEEALLCYKAALGYFSKKDQAQLKDILLDKIRELSYNAST